MLSEKQIAVPFEERKRNRRLKIQGLQTEPRILLRLKMLLSLRMLTLMDCHSFVFQVLCSPFILKLCFGLCNSGVPNPHSTACHRAMTLAGPGCKDRSPAPCTHAHVPHARTLHTCMDSHGPCSCMRGRMHIPIHAKFCNRSWL